VANELKKITTWNLDEHFMRQFSIFSEID